MQTLSEKRLFLGLVVPTLILWLLVTVLPPVGHYVIGEKYQFQAMFMLMALSSLYLMCLGVILSTGIYLSIAIYFYIKRKPKFIHCCGGISIYGALLGCLVSMVAMFDGSLSILLIISVPITVYFACWVERIKKHICIRKVRLITVLTLVTSIIVPVSCVYLLLF